METVSAGEIIVAMLGVSTPIIGIGVLVWRLSDSLRGVRELATHADSKATLGLDRTSENTRAIGDLNIRLARDHPLKSDIKSDLREMEARITEKLEMLLERLTSRPKRGGEQ